MLNYNISYICWTQERNVPLEQVTLSLDNLALVCQSPQLGLTNHQPHIQYDYYQVHREHLRLFSKDKPWEVVALEESCNTEPPELADDDAQWLLVD